MRKFCPAPQIPLLGRINSHPSALLPRTFFLSCLSTALSSSPGSHSFFSIPSLDFRGGYELCFSLISDWRKPVPSPPITTFWYTFSVDSSFLVFHRFPRSTLLPRLISPPALVFSRYSFSVNVRLLFTNTFSFALPSPGQCLTHPVMKPWVVSAYIVPCS